VVRHASINLAQSSLEGVLERPPQMRPGDAPDYQGFAIATTVIAGPW
jgi:hypothetical protein